MKFQSSLVLFASMAVQMTSAFTVRPSSSFGGVVSTPSTTARNIIDKKFYSDLSESDATRVVIEECDIEECTRVEGERDGAGWSMHGELSSEQTTAKVLMMETSDTE